MNTFKKIFLLSSCALTVPLFANCSVTLTDVKAELVDKEKIYAVGSTMAKSDIKVTVTYSNKKTKELATNDWQCSDFVDDVYTFEDDKVKTFNISYSDKTTNISVQAKSAKKVNWNKSQIEGVSKTPLELCKDASSVIFGSLETYKEKVSGLTSYSIDEDKKGDIKLYYDNASATDIKCYILSDYLIYFEDLDISFSEFAAKEIRFENAYTGLVSHFEGMFYNCVNLETLYLKQFDTSSAVSFRDMFRLCKKLKLLNLSDFNTSNVSNMRCMFLGCESLKSLDVSKFDTSNVTDFSQMFADCQSLTSLNVTNFNTGNAKDISGMFRHCPNLSSINLSSFDTSNVTDMSQLFLHESAESKLTYLDLSHFNTSKVEKTYDMFNNCKNLKTIYVSNTFITDNISDEYDYDMFKDCKSLIGEKGTAFSSSYPLDKSLACVDGKDGIPGYFTEKLNPETENLEYIFNKTNKTATVKAKATLKGDIIVPDTVTDGSNDYTVTEVAEGGFKDNNNLISILLPKNITKVNKYAFSNCKNLTLVDISRCVGLTKLDDGAFSGCENLAICDLTHNINLDSIGDACFYNTSLSNVVIHRYINTIESNAFSSNSKLSSVSFEDTNATWAVYQYIEGTGWKTIDAKFDPNNDPTQTITYLTDINVYMKKNELETSDLNWFVFNLRGESFPGEAKVSFNYGYEGLPESITKIVIPEEIDGSKCGGTEGVKYKVTLIDNEGFYYNYNKTEQVKLKALETIVLPNSINSIAGYGIACFPNLNTLTFPKNIPVYGMAYGAITNNLNLTTIYAESPAVADTPEEGYDTIGLFEAFSKTETTAKCALYLHNSLIPAGDSYIYKKLKYVSKEGSYVKYMYKQEQ